MKKGKIIKTIISYIDFPDTPIQKEHIEELKGHFSKVYDCGKRVGLKNSKQQIAKEIFKKLFAVKPNNMTYKQFHKNTCKVRFEYLK